MLDAVYRTVMQKGTDYDTLPGTSKPSLLKPGAEFLARHFDLVAETKIVNGVEKLETGQKQRNWRWLTGRGPLWSRWATKDLTRKLPFARSIRSCMSNLRDRNEFSAKDPVVEAVYRAYVYTQMYLAPDEVRTEVLRDLGLGHIVIPKLSEKGQPFDRYGRPGEAQ